MSAAEVVVDEAADGEAVSGAAGPPTGRAARAVDAVISGYQAVRIGRPSPCRFLPSCSSYAREAVAIHGAGRGTWLALRRLGRCRPGGGHGWDPVPEAELTSRMMGGRDDGDPPPRTAG